MAEARPPFVRIFFNRNALTDDDMLSSFYATVELARRSEAELNVTWQGSTYPFAVANMPRFASIIGEVLKARTGSWVWVTLFNEPNSSATLTLAQYEDVYRRLDAELKALGIRDHVRFMGGDLLGQTSPLGKTQTDWFQYMAGRMGDLLEAWSVHIVLGLLGFGQDRTAARRGEGDAPTRFLRACAAPSMSPSSGTRGLATFEGEDNYQPGQWPDGTPMTLTTTAAFQQAWFMMRAAQLGYTGTIKWDMYAAKYDAGTQDHSAIGLDSGNWVPRPGTGSCS